MQRLFPSPQSTNYSAMLGEREREPGDVERQPNLMQIHNTPPPQQQRSLPHLYSRFMISNRLGRGLLFCLTFPPLQTPVFPFFHLICGKINCENKHPVSLLRFQVNLDFVACFCRSFSERFNRFHMSHTFHRL